jgi:hypothetical protein
VAAAVLFLLLLGLFAGTFGALVGLGGGIILVPVLSLWFGLPITTAVGVSLVCVIATSSGAAAIYVQERLTDMRLGMLLELASSAGAITGALIVPYLSPALIKGLFGAFLLYSAVLMVRNRTAEPEGGDLESYRVRNYPLGLGVSYAAGNVSAILGIGGGPIKVPLMNVFMGVPLRVAAATSNFLMGVTAAASAILYFTRDDVLVAVAAPLAVGVFAGAFLGSWLARRLRSRWIRFVLVVVLLYLSALMLGEALGFHIPGRGR